jgi:hypothetical protein
MHTNHADPIYACVLHGDYYDWRYVERLRSMLRRHADPNITLHVFTEPTRTVPSDYCRHDLRPWDQVHGPRQAWWYKMQMFDPRHGLGRVIYLDLDVVLVGDCSWLAGLDSAYFWAPRDFRYLWRPSCQQINSSVMVWDNAAFPEIWRGFAAQDIAYVMRRFKGDQDYIYSSLPQDRLRFIDPGLVKSWRWEIHDGGIDPVTRRPWRPGSGGLLSPDARILVFHGHPKPHEIADSVIIQHWS